MKVCRSFKYRVYPTISQVKTLGKWDGALRFLWNLALEQRRMGLSRTDKFYPSAFDQINELTELRRALPWLASVPRHACGKILTDLDMSFQRCFAKICGFPNWKRKGCDFLGPGESDPKGWRVCERGIRFPKLGILRGVIHVTPEGRPKTCTIIRDGDQWFAAIVCESDVPDPTQRTEPVIALDRGITNLLADSDGNLTPNPKHYDKALKRLAHAQRAVSRKQKGSKNREKAKIRVMRIHRKVRRQREHFLHCLSATIAKSNGVVVMEKLNVSGMARGNCSRGISGAGWSTFNKMLRYKLAWSGGSLVEVPAQYSSQTCSVCGTVDSASRKADQFNCTGCGHGDHADLNAAKVLKQRYETPGNPWCLPVDGLLLEGSGGSRKEKVKLRVPRRKILKTQHRTGVG